MNKQERKVNNKFERMIKMKKIITIILALVICAIMFVGCQSKNGMIDDTTERSTTTSTTMQTTEQSTTSKMLEDAKDKADKVGDDVGDGVDKVADGVGGAVDKAGDAVKDTLE